MAENMTMVRMASRHAKAAEELLLMAIHEAIKVNGASWASVGRALGTSRQYAHRHYHDLVEALDAELRAHVDDEDEPPAPG
jgi:hypothetical protein